MKVNQYVSWHIGALRRKAEYKYGIIKIETDVVNNKYSIQKEGNAEYWESASDLEKESNS